MSKFGFAGSMPGSENMFKLVAAALRERGHECVVLPPVKAGEVWGDDLLALLKDCTFGVLGLGSFPDRRIAEAGAADVFAKRGITFVVMGDTPESQCRFEQGSTVHELARHIIVADPGSVEDATKLGWNEPRYLGLPPHLYASYLKMVSSEYKTFRAHNGVRTFVIEPEDTVLFLPGTNAPDMDLRTLRLIEEAVKGLPVRGRLIWGYRQHPMLTGANAPPIAAEIDAFFADKLRLDYGNADMAETIRHPSVVTIFGGLSSEMHPAAHAGARGIYFADDESLARNERQGAKKGGIPIVVERVGFPFAQDVDGMHQELELVLDPNSYDKFSAARVLAFPKLSDSDPAIAYAEFLISLATERG